MGYIADGAPLLFPLGDHRGTLAAAIKDLAGNLGGFVGDFVVYVDSTFGNDSNDGLSSATALLNLDTAFSRLPMFWRGKCRIYLAAGTYPTSIGNVNLGGPLGANSQAFFIIGPMVDSGLGVRNTDAASTALVVNVVGGGLTVDALVGQRVRYTSGTQNGETRTVTENSATAITLNLALGGAPVAGDTFVIEKAGATITPVSHLTMSTAALGPRPSRASIAMYGVKWIMPVTTGVLTFNGSGTFAWIDACEFDFSGAHNNSVAAQFGSNLIMAGLQFYYPDVSNSTFGAACYLRNGFLNTFNSGLIVKLGAISTLYLVMDSCAVDITLGGTGYFVAPYMKKGGIAVDDRSMANFFSPGTIDGAGVVGKLLYVRTNSIIDGIGPLVLKNSNDDALYVDRSSVVGATAITGTGNTGYGIHLASGASVVADAATTVTGVAGDILVGATPSTHANLTAAGFVTDANQLARVSRV